MPPRSDQRQAVALRYETNQDSAPTLTAKGAGATADKIVEIARRHNIPIHQDRNLVQILSTLDLNQEIPQNVYAAVAEILAFVYRVGKMSRPSTPQDVAASKASSK